MRCLLPLSLLLSCILAEPPRYELVNNPLFYEYGFGWYTWGQVDWVWDGDTQFHIELGGTEDVWEGVYQQLYIQNYWQPFTAEIEFKFVIEQTLAETQQHPGDYLVCSIYTPEPEYTLFDELVLYWSMWGPTDGYVLAAKTVAVLPTDVPIIIDCAVDTNSDGQLSWAHIRKISITAANQIHRVFVPTILKQGE